MDKIEKALKKLSERERKTVKELLLRIKENDVYGLDIKKLKGVPRIYRVRKGDIRIIYRMTTQNEIFVLAIERRSKSTYKHF